MPIIFNKIPVVVVGSYHKTELIGKALAEHYGHKVEYVEARSAGKKGEPDFKVTNAQNTWIEIKKDGNDTWTMNQVKWIAEHPEATIYVYELTIIKANS